MLTPEALRTLRDASAAVRDAGAAQAAAVRAQVTTARMARQSAFAAAGSRLFAAAVVAATIWGVAADLPRAHQPVATVTNVATKSDVDCVRSDVDVYLGGVAPNPLCGPPPGRPTPGTVKP